jgi:hypothetical protein
MIGFCPSFSIPDFLTFVLGRLNEAKEKIGKGAGFA